jgi:hypothetical protein
VTDDKGLISTADVTFTINQNNSPIAKAWLAEYKSSSSVLLSGWASYDPEGGPVTYQWTYVAGPGGYIITDGTSYNATVSNLSTGSYTFKLTVKDRDGLTASQDVTFDIKSTARPANAAPIAKAWLAEYKSSSSVLLSGWASYDPEGKPVSYIWSYVSGPGSYSITDGSSYNATINNLVAGTYTFRLTVKDDLGQIASENVTFTMNAMARTGLGRNDLSLYDQHAANSKLAIYPNPVATMLQYKWSSTYRGTAKLTVMDMSGRAVKVTQLRKEQDGQVSKLNVSDLKAGAYYLYIRMKDGKMISTKFSKK